MDPILVSTKQQPVIDRLSDITDMALACAAAVMDNATDDGQPIPAELVANFVQCSVSIPGRRAALRE